ncbi:hypothetical protein GCM10010371_57360 [Streptomyces subrutilus]|uniref:Uncharacterized protein n=1 Tax=Streptomyces subrutilus TaxID=36818 RepID=A0A918R8X6_9ACTN|nr:hypothetical protein GCM10010371_57360 [Streptomyces subrutilus]
MARRANYGAKSHRAAHQRRPEPWRDLINNIHALRLNVYDIADRLRSLSSTSWAPLPDQTRPCR